MAERRLGVTPYFAGAEFTAANIIMTFPLTRMRLTVPKDISGYPNILSYLQRIGTPPAFQRACEKSDAGIAPHLT
jgi:glutathione S-transferase